MVERLALLGAMVEGITKENVWADLRFSVNRRSGRDEHSRRRKEHGQRQRIMGYQAYLSVLVS